MSTSVVNTAELRSDDKIVDENDQELPVGTVVHCLGALFKVTNSGISLLILNFFINYMSLLFQNSQM